MKVKSVLTIVTDRRNHNKLTGELSNQYKPVLISSSSIVTFSVAFLVGIPYQIEAA